MNNCDNILSLTNSAVLCLITQGARQDISKNNGIFETFNLQHLVLIKLIFKVADKLNYHGQCGSII